MAEQMWRVVAVFRVVTLVYAAVLITRDHHGYSHRAAGWLALAVMAVWSVITIAAYSRPGRPAAPAQPRLTDRETEVLRLAAKGMRYPEIAALLVLSPRTVQNHVQNTLIKLQLHNKAQLVRYALEQGID